MSSLLLLLICLLSLLRVHAHAAAALINFCEGVERDTLIPYLDAIVARLLKLLEPQYGKDGKVKSYVQEQAVTTLAMVADVSEATFAKVCLQNLYSCWIITFLIALHIDYAAFVERTPKCKWNRAQKAPLESDGVCRPHRYVCLAFTTLVY